jgi:hypothetical protein
MRKLTAILIPLLFITVFLSPIALAATSDTFTITVTGEYIECNIEQATWSINSGTPVSMSTNYFTNASDTFDADVSNSSVDIDLKLQITSDAATWTAATAGNPAASDTYLLNASIDTWVADDNQVIAASATTISTGITAGQDETFDLMFGTPTATTTGSEQTITVTASCVAN